MPVDYIVHKYFVELLASCQSDDKNCRSAVVLCEIISQVYIITL